MPRQLIRRPVGIHGVQRGVGDPTGCLQGRQHARHQIPHIDDVHQIGAQGLDAPEKLVLFLEHPAVHHPFQARAQGLEHDDDRG